MNAPRPDEKSLCTKSLRYSYWDGTFAGAMIGFTQDYFTPFLLLLGAGPQQVGLLNSFPNFAAALSQIFSAEITAKVGSRKKVITLFVLLQALMMAPMAYIAFRQGTRPIIFIGLVTLFNAFGALALPPWGSWMSDLVDERKRGEFFGRRNKIIGFVMVGTSFFAGFILHWITGINVFYGFTLIFLSAGIFRLISWYFLHQMYEPSLEHTREDHFTFFMFLRRLKHSNFAKFVIFVSLFNFSVHMAAPFFAVFMLKDLKFNYLIYSVITASATFMVFFLMRRWGRQADRVGNLRVIKFTAPIIGILPLFWTLNQHPLFLLSVQIISGFAWSGFNLCCSNFIFDAVSPRKRTRCIAYFNTLNGLALCIGALTGGFLVERLPVLWGYKSLSLFVLSGLLRTGAAIFLPRMLKEVRSVETVSNETLLLNMIKLRG